MSGFYELSHVTNTAVYAVPELMLCDDFNNRHKRNRLEQADSTHTTSALCMHTIT